MAVGEYQNQQIASTGSGNLLAGLMQSANVVDYGQYGYYPHPYWQPPYYYPSLTIVVRGHRVCTCPNCAGDCCDCADCKVKRLEKRVADLEAGR